MSVANELVSYGKCSEMDAVLDLWINTVYNDSQVKGSDVSPLVYIRNGTGKLRFLLVMNCSGKEIFRFDISMQRSEDNAE